MTWESVPVCQACWDHTHPEAPPYRVLARDLGRGGHLRLVDQRGPSERCHYCGVETRSGIYVRAQVRPPECSYCLSPATHRAPANVGETFTGELLLCAVHAQELVVAGAGEVRPL